MKPRSLVLGVLLLSAGVGGGILLTRHFPMLNGSPAVGPSAEPSAGRRVLYWWDPMMPAFKSDKPGKSPMGMDMVPVFEGDPQAAPEPGVVTIEPGAIERLGVRTAVTARASVTPMIETFGTVTFDESRVSHVHVRTRGWIERLQTRVEGETVKAGQVLFEFFSPDLVNASNEYLRELQRGVSSLIDGPEIIRRKLLNLGMTDRQIDEIRRTRQTPDRIQVLAPRAGVIEQLGVAEGMFVEPTLTLMSIIDHEQIWIIADVIESQAAFVRLRAAVEARAPSQPGRVWTGTVDYVYPRLNADTRTVRVRMRFDNPDLVLKHNMFATVRIATPARDNVIAIPTEALIRTGAGDRVVLALGDGRFRPTPVKAGIAAGGKVEILDGLTEGDRVVASAHFLLDSESSLSAGLARLGGSAAGGATNAGDPIWTDATVNAAPTSDHQVNLSHPPIPQIGWPAMTMDFAVDPAVPTGALRAGEHRRIGLAKNADGTYRVVAVETKGAAR